MAENPIEMLRMMPHFKNWFARGQLHEYWPGSKSMWGSLKESTAEEVGSIVFTFPFLNLAQKRPRAPLSYHKNRTGRCGHRALSRNWVG